VAEIERVPVTAATATATATAATATAATATATATASGVAAQRPLVVSDRVRVRPNLTSLFRLDNVLLPRLRGVGMCVCVCVCVFAVMCDVRDCCALAILIPFMLVWCVSACVRVHDRMRVCMCMRVRSFVRA
jgi:hypothetical protein